MEFVILNEEEFTTFSLSHKNGTFHQMPGWGKLKQRYGWNYYIVGLKEKGKIIAAALLLEKRLFKNYTLLYSPRGFLIDFKNEALVKIFTNEIRKFAKEKNAIFVKIDPYVIARERDINGKIVENGINNTPVINMLKNLGYKHNGFTLGMEDLQPRWAFALYFNGRNEEEILKNMESKTRQLIRKNIKIGIDTREIKIDDVKVFKDIMEHTADRRNFIDRPLDYYQSMLKCLKDNAKILVAELNLNNYINTLESELEENNKLIISKKHDIESKKANLNVDKTNKKIKECENNIIRIEKQLDKAHSLKKEHGKIITLGGIIFMNHGKEMLSLFGGAYKEFMDFLSPYTTNWNMIKFAIANGYEKYNFYGIDGHFDDKSNEMYGLYDFKRGFGGVVDEYIGEFNLVINKPMYYLYNIAFFIYGKLKKIKRRSE